MKILILTTYYPPDTAIAAVRPYMFAKYLSQRGHQVTVLRSGEINKWCEDFFEHLPAVRVISYLGENSPAERYQRGEWLGAKEEGHSRIGFLPNWIRRPVAKIYHSLTRKKDIARRLKYRCNCHEQQKVALDAMSDEAFDIVFSTAGEFENVLAGQYAAKLFDCPWIQDFRDPMAAKVFQRKKEYTYMKSIQETAVENADACIVVSEGAVQSVCGGLHENKLVVIYNGYEPTTAIPSANANPQPSGFTICYTGQVYADVQDFSPLLKALKHLDKQGRISLSNIHIHYAGNSFDYLLAQAEKLGVAEILVNHGQVTRSEAAKIQASSDLFTVLSWNTKTSKGILTGKFYEGIRAEKPILSIVAGEVPNSELNLINQRYHYGFCYESCREKEQFQQLCDYLETLYNEKITTGKIIYKPEPELKTDFRYDTLAIKLETLCLEIIRKKK